MTLIVGQQNLRYGNGLVIGDPDTNQGSIDALAFTGVNGDLSLRKSFDAVRAILDYAPYTVDLVYAKIYENTGFVVSLLHVVDVDLASML